MCLGVFILRIIQFGTLWDSWTWVAISFPILGKFSTIISSSIFSRPFFLPSSSGTSMIQMLGHLTSSQRSLRFSSCLLILIFSLSASLMMIKHKEQILKAVREKQQITHEGIPIRITGDLSPPAFPRNPRGRLGFPGPTQGEG